MRIQRGPLTEVEDQVVKLLTTSDDYFFFTLDNPDNQILLVSFEGTPIVVCRNASNVGRNEYCRDVRNTDINCGMISDDITVYTPCVFEK